MLLKVKSFAGAMRKASLIAALPLLFSACADDISGTVDVYTVKGPISGSVCNLYRADTNTVLGETVTTVDNGFATFGNVAFAGVGYVSCTGGEYIDEATGAKASLDGITMRAGKRFSGGTTFIVSPLTEIAMQRAEAADGGIVENIEAFNQSVADDFGISAVDITSVLPTDLNVSPAQDDPAGWYGTVLAGVSQYVADNPPATLDQMITQLADKADINDGDFGASLGNLGNNNPTLANNVNPSVVTAIQGGLGSNTDGTPGNTSRAACQGCVLDENGCPF